MTQLLTAQVWVAFVIIAMATTVPSQEENE